MNHLLKKIIAPVTSANFVQLIWSLLRISIGILTFFHGVPKMTGFSAWHNLGVTIMYPLGIKFLPTVWGFLGGITEFFGGLFFTMGFGTRFASFALIIMMFIATNYHLANGDSFQVYSFPLTLIFVYLAFLILGSGTFSIDHLLTKRKKAENS